MGNKSKKREVRAVPPVTEVEIEFRVTIREIHNRTATVCDKRGDTHFFEFGHDFEAARDWLESDESYFAIDALCAKACAEFAAKSGSKR